MLHPFDVLYMGRIMPVWILIFMLLLCESSEVYGKSSNPIPKQQSKVFEMPSLPQSAIPKINKIAQSEWMVRVEPGEFIMGSDEDEVGHDPINEKRNRVRISQPFWIKKFEVTRGEWNSLVDNPMKKGERVFSLSDQIIEEICSSKGYEKGHFAICSYGEDDSDIYLEEAVFSGGFWAIEKAPRRYKIDSKKFKNMEALLQFFDLKNIRVNDRLDNALPVSGVSYNQAVAFCWKKTEMARGNNQLPSPLVFRLPTEAEWEYACRAGTSGFCGTGEGNFLSGENANIRGDSRSFIIDQRQKSKFSDGGAFVPRFRKKLIPVKKNSPIFSPNAWGLYDMHGNVLEWCYDYHSPYPDINYTRVDPIGPIRGTERVLRGGSFLKTAQSSRSASRLKYEPSYRGSEIGFRYLLGMPLR